MARYAVVNAENKVVNVIEWDGVSTYTPKPGCSLVASEVCDKGDDFDPADETFLKKDGKKHHKNKKLKDYKDGK